MQDFAKTASNLPATIAAGPQVFWRNPASMVAVTGFEPVTLRVRTECSSQLSYTATISPEFRVARTLYENVCGCQALRRAFLQENFSAALRVFRETDQWRGNGRRCPASRGDDGLPGAVRTAADLDGRPQRRAGRDARQHALAAAQQARGRIGVLLGGGQHFVVDVGVKHFGHKARADALQPVRPGRAARKHGAARRFHGHDAHGGGSAA